MTSDQTAACHHSAVVMRNDWEDDIKYDYYYYYYAYYYYKRIWLKCHRLLGLQKHFTIIRTRLESSMLQRMSKAEQLSDTVRAKTSQEQFWFETPPESSEWHRRGDARRQIVPYARSRDRKCAIANGGVAPRRYNECRCRHRPHTPSRVCVRSGLSSSLSRFVKPNFLQRVVRTRKAELMVVDEGALSLLSCN